MNNSYVVYRGASRLNGLPIMAVITGLQKPSANRKTGPLAQLWILPQVESIRQLFDDAETESSVCGDCPLRKNNGLGVPRQCYVNPMAMQSIYRSSPPSWDAPISELPVNRRLVRGIRFGAFGDPSALPIELLEQLAARFNNRFTGYTRQWRRFPEYQRFLMASVLTAQERFDAVTSGWRYFSAIDESEPPPPDSILCLAEAKNVACSDCRLCNGSGRTAKVNVHIPLHGSSANTAIFAALRAAEQAATIS
jgi:hypothetical protein